MASILEKIEAHLQTHRMAAWEGTFRDYLSLVLLQPALAQRAHTRLNSMIHAAGVRVDVVGKEHYTFFEHDLFGIDEPLAKVVEYFKAAAPVDCPQHEDPLNLIPHALHREFQEETGIYSEGELCPLYALTLQERYLNTPGKISGGHLQGTGYCRVGGALISRR